MKILICALFFHFALSTHQIFPLDVVSYLDNINSEPYPYKEPPKYKPLYNEEETKNDPKIDIVPKRSSNSRLFDNIGIENWKNKDNKRKGLTKIVKYGGILGSDRNFRLNMRRINDLNNTKVYNIRVTTKNVNKYPRVGLIKNNFNGSNDNVTLDYRPLIDDSEATSIDEKPKTDENPKQNVKNEEISNVAVPLNENSEVKELKAHIEPNHNVLWNQDDQKNISQRLIVKANDDSYDYPVGYKSDLNLMNNKYNENLLNPKNRPEYLNMNKYDSGIHIPGINNSENFGYKNVDNENKKNTIESQVENYEDKTFKVADNITGDIFEDTSDLELPSSSRKLLDKNKIEGHKEYIAKEHIMSSARKIEKPNTEHAIEMLNEYETLGHSKNNTEELYLGNINGNTTLENSHEIGAVNTKVLDELKGVGNSDSLKVAENVLNATNKLNEQPLNLISASGKIKHNGSILIPPNDDDVKTDSDKITDTIHASSIVSNETAEMNDFDNKVDMLDGEKNYNVTNAPIDLSINNENKESIIQTEDRSENVNSYKNEQLKHTHTEIQSQDHLVSANNQINDEKKDQLQKMCKLARLNLKALRKFVANKYSLNTKTAEENDLITIVYIMGLLNEARKTEIPVEEIVNDFLNNLRKLGELRKLLCEGIPESNQEIDDKHDIDDIITQFDQYFSKTTKELHNQLRSRQNMYQDFLPYNNVQLVRPKLDHLNMYANQPYFTEYASKNNAYQANQNVYPIRNDHVRVDEDNDHSDHHDNLVNGDLPVSQHGLSVKNINMSMYQRASVNRTMPILEDIDKVPNTSTESNFSTLKIESHTDMPVLEYVEDNVTHHVQSPQKNHIPELVESERKLNNIPVIEYVDSDYLNIGYTPHAVDSVNQNVIPVLQNVPDKVVSVDTVTKNNKPIPYTERNYDAIELENYDANELENYDSAPDYKDYTNKILFSDSQIDNFNPMQMNNPSNANQNEEMPNMYSVIPIEDTHMFSKDQPDYIDTFQSIMPSGQLVNIKESSKYFKPKLFDNYDVYTKKENIYEKPVYINQNVNKYDADYINNMDTYINPREQQMKYTKDNVYGYQPSFTDSAMQKYSKMQIESAEYNLYPKNNHYFEDSYNTENVNDYDYDYIDKLVQHLFPRYHSYVENNCKNRYSSKPSDNQNTNEREKYLSQKYNVYPVKMDYSEKSYQAKSLNGYEADYIDKLTEHMHPENFNHVKNNLFTLYNPYKYPDKPRYLEQIRQDLRNGPELFQYTNESKYNHQPATNKQDYKEEYYNIYPKTSYQEKKLNQNWYKPGPEYFDRTTGHFYAKERPYYIKKYLPNFAFTYENLPASGIIKQLREEILKLTISSTPLPTLATPIENKVIVNDEITEKAADLQNVISKTKLNFDFDKTLRALSSTTTKPKSHIYEGPSAEEYEELLEKLKKYHLDKTNSENLTSEKETGTSWNKSPENHFDVYLNDKKLNFWPHFANELDKNEAPHNIRIKGDIQKVDLESLVTIAHEQVSNDSEIPLTKEFKPLLEIRNKVDIAIVTNVIWQEILRLRQQDVPEENISKYVYKLVTMDIPNVFMDSQKCRTDLFQYMMYLIKKSNDLFELHHT